MDVRCMDELDHKEGWAMKNWCHWTVVLEKTLEGPVACKENNQSIIQEINPEHSFKDWCWSSSSNTLAHWYKELTLEKTLMLGKIEGRMRRGQQRMNNWVATLTQWTVLDKRAIYSISSLSQSCLTILWPHGLQHTRLPCPSPTPKSLLKLRSIKTVMSSNHLLLPSILPSIKVFSKVSALCIREPKY